MSSIRPLRDVVLLVLAAALLVSAAAAGAEELALVDDIVVNGQRPEEPTAESLSIVVAATGATLPGRRGMGLSADDEVRTGAGVQVVLRFLDLDPEVDPLVFVDESSAYRLLDSTSLQGFFGRLFASVAGLFTVITPGGRLGVEGTEFEVLIDGDGAVDIRVLEGVVAFEPALAAEPAPDEEAAAAVAEEPEPADGSIDLRIDTDAQKVIRLGLTLTNACPGDEEFFVDSPPEIPWLRVVADPQPIAVPGGGRTAVDTEIWLDARGVAPGLYRGAILLRCADCVDCSLTRRSAPLAVEVLEPGGERTRAEQEESRRQREHEARRREAELRRRAEARATAASPPTAGARRGAPLRIQALESVSQKSPGETPAPAQMAEDEVVRVLDWTDEVYVAVQPSYAADGDPPHFESVAERSRAFRAARYEATWKNDPMARARLGNVYNDWGEDRRASKAYKEAVADDASLADSPDLIASWAEANRRAGRIERAQELAERAVALDPGSGRANVALGNVYRGFASQALENGDESTATAYLDRSAETFRRASRVADPGRGAGDQRLRGVAETKLAETYTDLAKTALARGETAEADRRLIAAQQAVRAADEAYSKSDNPFLLLAEGQLFQERARLAEARGDEVGRNRELELAQQTYAVALEKHKDLAPAHYRIATVYEQKGEPDRAEAEYEKAVESQPTYTPTYQNLGRLKEIRSPGSGTGYIGRDLKLVPAKIVPRIDPTPSVPRLIGLELDEAEKTLRETGFALGGISRAAGGGRAGTVIAQQPAAGSRARAGTPVDLTLAAPDLSFAMPDVRGLGLEEARRRLADAGLGSLRIREKRGGKRAEITGQSPRPGTRVSPGTAVELELTVPQPIKVPDLVGRSEREALAKIRKEGFAAGDITREPSCESPGRVLRQSPERGAKLPPGASVALVVTTPGPNAQPVPRLVGAGRADAERLLSRSGFRLGEVEEREGDEEPETVLAQRPEAGSQLGAGCPVALTVVKPPALVEVPDFVGQELSELQRTLSRLALAVVGVRIGRVSEVDSRQHADGTVIRQSPEAGSRVPRNSPVDLWVARRPDGPKRVELPDLRGQPAQQAAEILKELGLRPTISGNCHKVQRQSPGPGTQVAPGSTVTLIVGDCVQ